MLEFTRGLSTITARTVQSHENKISATAVGVPALGVSRSHDRPEPPVPVPTALSQIRPLLLTDRGIASH